MMDPRAVDCKTLSFAEETLLQQNVEFYVDTIKKIFANTRVGDLLLKEHAITASLLEKALQIQQKDRGFLGDTLIKMGAVGSREIHEVLNFQKIRRFQSVCSLLLEKLRLGQILLNNRTITARQLWEALKKQKKDKKLLGETLVEMRIISRNTLRSFLKIQKNVKKVVVMSSLALLLGAGATADAMATEKYPRPRPQGYDHRGTPSPVTPYEFKYKQVRDYLKKANQFKYEAEKKGADKWQLPEETERLGKGDCEDKAIWLYSKLLHDGFDNVRLVIGKQREDSSTFHTWVAWYPQEKIYILDPTYDSELWEIQKYPEGYYKPYYSFYRDKSWTHSGKPEHALTAAR